MNASPTTSTRGWTWRVLEAVGRPRWLMVTGAATVLLYLAMIPSFHGMSDHGASLGSFEDASSVGESTEIVTEWGDAGRDAARNQLLIDLPFLVSYALFLAGACMFVAARAKRVGRERLRRIAEVLAWCGPIAAAFDIAQNISLALILDGHHNQPWPRISADTAIVTRSLAALAIVFAVVGTAITFIGRSRTSPTESR
jgi:hypothetical protein